MGSVRKKPTASLVPLKRISGRGHQVQGFGQSANQFPCGVGAASQMASGNQLVLGASAIGQDSSGNQFNYDSASLNAVGRSMIEIDEGRDGIARDVNGFDLGYGALAHDGSYKLFRWDNAKGCMTPVESSIPIVTRLKRAFSAFAREWSRK